ncbi:MAG TPA: GyrI-like domain-containing protein [Frankiaceae bacterium]|nr:GyrI-like domain-containing protein [Frankiaceae bacterium]
MTAQVAFRQTHEELYGTRRSPEIVEVPPATFLMANGQGEPETSAAFAQGIQALYSVVYPLTFTLKKAGATNLHVPPLEGLWDAGSQQLLEVPKDEWNWTLMLRLPEMATVALVQESIAAAARKKPELPVRELRAMELVEGTAAQVLHVGPYDAEGPTIERLHAFIADEGYRPHGRHHEIYLGDPRRAAPAKLRTLLRQPVIGADASGG